jgi:hypothetical protein
MKKKLMRFVNSVRNLLIKARIAPPAQGRAPVREESANTHFAPAPTPRPVNSSPEALRALDAVLDEICPREQQHFRMRAHPVGFSGSDIIFDAAKRYPLGSRITRQDGRVYEVYRANGIKFPKTVQASPAPSRRVNA